MTRLKSPGKITGFRLERGLSAKMEDPAWKTKQSWIIVVTEDRTINPDLEREMASHAVFASHQQR